MKSEIKLFEVRDRATHVSAVAIAISAAGAESNRESAILERAGFGEVRCILFGHLAEPNRGLPFDPAEHKGPARTMPAAHSYIIEHWDELQSGDLVDVRFILGETPAPCASELPA
jgi:hypothetical protein